MEWMLEENVEMNMDWCVVESREHAYMDDLLEMGDGDGVWGRCQH
jgi:hypothetical protein